MNSSQQSIMELTCRPFFLFFLFAVFNFPLISHAASVATSQVEWTQLETKHFYIIFDKSQPDLGLYYSQVAEQAYSNLSSIFSTLPEKVTLVLNDNTDTSNGNATVFPYPLIFAYPVQVGQQDALSESGEWAKELVTHELTHVAQLYPYSGTGYKVARALFGSIISPNLLMPLWWKEGMAVEMETQFSHQGRTRSYMQDAQFRSYVTKNTLSNYDLSQANEVLVTWPYGNRPYFFGSMIMSQISKKSNPSAIGQITLEQSSLPPYFVNSPIEDFVHSNYDEIYNQAIDDIRINSENQIAELKKVPSPEPEKIDSTLLQSKSVQFSETHQLLAFLGTNDAKTQLQFYQMEKDPNRWALLKLKHLPSGSISQLSFHPTERKVIFSKTHQVSLHQNYSDLFIYDLDQEKIDNLTSEIRGRDPVYSLDGNFALFLSTQNGATELKQIEIQNKNITTVVKNDYHTRINSYAYLNANEIVYTQRNKTGEQELYVTNLTTLSPVKITAPKQIRFLKNKNGALYFTSTENEVQNIYSAKFDGKRLNDIKSVTHVMTGVLNFDVDVKNNTAYATLISESGPAIFRLPFLPENTKLPKIENDVLNRYEVHADLPFDGTTTPTEYSSWRYLYPHYWIPFISTNMTGDGVLYQALTSATDPVGFHSYAAQLNYDSFSQKVGYLFNYTNAQFSTVWNLSAFQTQQLFGLSNYVRKNTYSLSISPDTFSLNEDLRFSFGALAPQTEYASANTSHLGGYAQVAINTVEEKSNHYYPMTGYNLIARYASLADQKNQINSIYGNYSQALLSLTSYNHLFLPKDHTLMVKFDGLYTFEDVANRFGTSNLSLSSEAEELPLYLIRGYQAGQFLGTQMGTLNVEYRFPIYDLSRGSGTTPLFIKYLTGGLVADALAVKGTGFDKNDIAQSLMLNKQIYSAGIEARLSTTVGYVLPLHFIYGFYFPMSKDYAKDSFVSALNIQMGGF